MKKINGKSKILFHCFIVSLFTVLVYSRFIGLDWGLPYPMHPDERNMANAIQQLSCEFSIFNFQFSNLKECFNPHFFAYGQFPLYLGYLIVYFLKFFDGDMGFPISFQEATISLRIISAVASILNVFILLKIVELFYWSKSKSFRFTLSFALCALIFALSPYAIQFAHFGTTESLLMLFYSLIIYLSMRLLERRTTYAVVWLGFVSGLAVATKVSSAIFLIVPIATLISKAKIQKYKSKLISDFVIPAKAGIQTKITIFKMKLIDWIPSYEGMTLLTFTFLLLTSLFTLAFSPHNLINFHDFSSSIRFESDVALGKVLVFYTRQFFNTISIWFQLTKIFPYVLGWPMFILGSLGILGGLGWKDKKINLLRFAILVYFIPNAFLFAKWTRFISPVFPLILVLAILFLLKIRINIIKIIIIILAILPGLAYLSIYQNPDVRFQASEWIYKNIPENSYILSETANVIDIPMSNRTMKQLNNYNVISFNFYDLDENPELQIELKNHLEKADYIFVPSRRIFANHPKKKYPMLNQYYNDLFNGKLGFIKVAEFSAGLNDEQAEETWTVFDHPVIRIYKRKSL
jgi:hypothetical protein